jgi:hypothetical protein
MRVEKWVDFSQTVEIEIGADDVSAAISEAFAKVERDIDDTPNRHDVLRCFTHIGTFLNAVKEEHIALLTDVQRKTIREFLNKNGARF